MTDARPGRRGEPARPRRVGDYELLSRLGEGGMGIVYLARRPGGDRVALKVMRPHIVGDEEARGRMAREVGSLRRIRSRWVAEIFDADPWAPVPYVATRYVPGLSLHDDVVENGPFTGGDLMWLAAGLAEGLHAVHAAGVLHRDVKPSNVLMEGRTPILIDFGLARMAEDPKLTHTGWLLGTPGYLAPEILYGDDATTASDVHSWAATVAYAGLGRAPFGRGPSMAIMDRVRRGQHDLRGIASPLREVLAAALEPEPDRRPTLDAVLAWLRPSTTRPGPLLVAPPTGPETAGDSVADHFDDALRLLSDQPTVPTVAAARAESEAPTMIEATLREPAPPPTRYDDAPPPPRPPEPGPDRFDRWGEPTPSDLMPQEPAPPATERARRAGAQTAAALLVGAAAAALPWVTLIVVCVLVWLLRSGSLAASAVGERRVRRGRRWYDGALLLVHAPVHLVQAIPAALLLLVWGLGLAASAALLCYAASTGSTSALAIMGATTAVALWWGPGGDRLRGPVNRLVHPLSVDPRRWLVLVGALLLMALVLGLVAEASGSAWFPAGAGPSS